jgi:predicted enzyme related to lactoylglutathione lyase
MSTVPATSSSVAANLKFRPETTCAVNVSDFAAAAKWYEDVLGFQKLYDVPEMGWGEWLTNVPGMTIGISEVEAGSVSTGQGGATLTFGVEDIETARGWLESRNVKFDGETQEIPGLVKLATFFDPDGNTFMLAQGLEQT